MIRIIAEIGSVHDGSFGNAIKLVEAAAACGADTVKFQTHIAEAETLADAPMPSYFTGEPRMAYFRRTGFSPDRWRQLRAACERCGVSFLSSPFSLEAVDLLQDVGVAAYKIPSGEVSNLPLLEKIATTRKPVLLSSGMSNWSELDAAVAALRPGGPITVLQCSSAYPCPPGAGGPERACRDEGAIRLAGRLFRSHRGASGRFCGGGARRDRRRKALRFLAPHVWQRRREFDGAR
jgi:N,N'-diacetyllegionaminate synthase